MPSDFEFPAVVRDEDGNEVEVDQEMLRDADFLNRVSHLPIVRGTLRAYELGKQRSKLVKYGGDLVESSVKAISRPVVGRLGASLGERGKEQLDDYGGIDGLASRLGCSLNRGLCPGSDHLPLARRREMFGENKFPEHEMKSFWGMVWENLQDPTLILLMAAALVSLSLFLFCLIVIPIFDDMSVI